MGNPLEAAGSWVREQPVRDTSNHLSVSHIQWGDYCCDPYSAQTLKQVVSMFSLFCVKRITVLCVCVLDST